jgi:hypothetical protein
MFGTSRVDKRFLVFNILAANVNLLPLAILFFLLNTSLHVDIKPPQYSDSKTGDHTVSQLTL